MQEYFKKLQHILPETAKINQKGELELAACSTVDLAAEFGTPLYVIDELTFRNACSAYKEALAQHYPAKGTVTYASKSLLNTAIAQLVLSEGLSFDVSSAGELFVAMHAGVRPENIHLHGNAKPKAELQMALDAGVGSIMVDNLDELKLLTELSSPARPQAILLRITPEIKTDTHKAIQTGQASSKFGIPLKQLNEAAILIKAASGLDLKGLHVHLGSQLFTADVFEKAIDVILDQVVLLKENHNLEIKELSPGGGIGAAYVSGQPEADVNGIVKRISETLVKGCQERALSLPHLILEPGRSISGRSGVALYEVTGTKLLPEGEEAKKFIHLDGGMGDNLRPALYDASYTVLVANKMNAVRDQRVHVSGRYCESGDVLQRNIDAPQVDVGDTVAFATAGAYTLSLANNYNMTLRPAVVLVKDGNAKLIQRRETYEDLISRDIGVS